VVEGVERASIYYLVWMTFDAAEEASVPKKDR
jgi:hypothetical protein